MTYLVTITSQGQISIPAPIRRRMGLDKVRKAMVSMVDDKMVMEPVNDFMSLRGIFKSNKKHTIEEEERAIGKGIVDDYQ